MQAPESTFYGADNFSHFKIQKDLDSINNDSDDEDAQRRELELQDNLACAFNTNQHVTSEQHEMEDSASSIYNRRSVQFKMITDEGTLNDEDVDDSEDEEEERRKCELADRLMSEFDRESFENSYGSPQNSYIQENQIISGEINHSSSGMFEKESQQQMVDIEGTNVWDNNSDLSQNYPSNIMNESSNELNLLSDNYKSSGSPFNNLAHGEALHYLETADNDSEFDRQRLSIVYESNSELRQSQLLNSESESERLQTLYEARGRELDRLSDELRNQKTLYEQKNLSLITQLKNVTGERERLCVSNDNLKILNGESIARIKSLEKDLEEKNVRMEAISEESKNLKCKLEVAESTISSLELQVTEIQNNDIFRKSQDAQAKFLQKLRHSHNEELEDLNRKLKASSQRIIEAEDRVQVLETKLQENRKANDECLQKKVLKIKEMDMELKAAEQQIQMLLSNPRISSNKEDDLLLEINNLKTKLNISEKELKSYDMLLKNGVFKSLFPNEDSSDYLGLVQNLNFDESISANTPIEKKGFSPRSKSMMGNDSIKQELIKCVLNNKAYREEVDKLREEGKSNQKLIQILQNELKSIKIDVKNEKVEVICSDDPKATLLEDNISLKEQNATMIKHFSTLKETSEKLLFSVNKICSNVRKSSNKFEDNYATLLEGLHNFTKALEHFNLEQHQTWEKMRVDNVRLNTQPRDLANNLHNIFESLENLKHNIEAKGYFVESSHASHIIQLLESFLTNNKYIKVETCQLIEENSHLRNEIWTLRLDHETMLGHYSGLQKEVQSLHKEREETKIVQENSLQKCKDQYLMFHDQALQEVKKKLQEEYESVINTLKEEIDRISKKLTEVQNHYMTVCNEKRLIEEIQQCNQIKLKEDSKLEQFIEENKRLIVNLEEKEAELKELNTKLALLTSISNKCEKIDRSTSITDSYLQGSQISNDTINKLRKENEMLTSKYLTEKVSQQKDLEKYKNELIHLQNQLLEYQKITAGKEKDPQNNDRVNYLHQTDQQVDSRLDAVDKQVERYKLMSEKYKQQGIQLKIYYEKQIDEKDHQLNNLTTNYIKNIIPLQEDVKHYEAKTKQLAEKIEQLTQRLHSSEETKLNLLKNHEEDIRTITDQLQDQESIMTELKNQYELKLQDQNKVVGDLGIDLEKLKEEINSLKKSTELQKDKQDVKYTKLRDRYLKLQNNFKKYKSHVNYYEKRSSSLLKSSQEDKAEQLNSFKKWLSEIRSALAEDILCTISKLEALKQNLIRPADLNSPLLHLNSLHEKLSKLKICHLKH